MAVKKQPDSDAAHFYETTDVWFRQFMKHLDLSLIEAGQTLAADAAPADYGLAAIRAVKLTLLDSGLDEEQLLGLLGLVALEKAGKPQELQWSETLNRRRFELIDGDIQGTLSRAQQFELAGLTQLMRDNVDSEDNLPMDGAGKLHRRLLDSDVWPAGENS